ncbi:MAG: class I SAM-dependent methyltransferase [Anaerolineae bacterium]|jgi:ubiquinone/menaquinone biosynthesis C-methylase UbiE|nr:class I SAM-dependent methyltransferase [Anaerolineae bacterium]
MSEPRRLCDYENSSYRTDFWEGQGREYEDRAERLALRRLLPPAGRRLVDVGAGFGRLSDFYEGYEQVVLLDYSTSLLRQAQERLGRDPRLAYVAANFYAMPFAAGTFDAAMMVRVMHHVEDVPAFLGQMGHILAGGGSFVVEFASKRHLKSILRWALGRQRWSPFDPEPYEFVEMNFDFHPAWMRARLAEAAFHVKQCRTVSHFRLPLLKRLVPAGALAALDGLLQPTGAWWQLTPSVFCRAVLDGPPAPATEELVFRCPACGSSPLRQAAEAMACGKCGRRWPIEDGIYNFKVE